MITFWMPIPVGIHQLHCNTFMNSGVRCGAISWIRLEIGLRSGPRDARQVGAGVRVVEGLMDLDRGQGRHISGERSWCGLEELVFFLGQW